VQNLFPRLDRPFNTLLEFVATQDLDGMDHEKHSHSPYLVLYVKALDKWRSNSQGSECRELPKNYQERKEFERLLTSMRKPDDKGSLNEENFVEAKTNMIMSLGGSKVIF